MDDYAVLGRAQPMFDSRRGRAFTGKNWVEVMQPRSKHDLKSRSHSITALNLVTFYHY